MAGTDQQQICQHGYAKVHIPHPSDGDLRIFPGGILRTPSYPQPWYVGIAYEEIHQTPAPQECGMGLVLPPSEAYQVQHLPIVKAYADKIGLVETINAMVPTEMAIDPGTIVLGMILDT